MSEKYEQVKRFYDLGVWSVEKVSQAVNKDWITAEEYQSITGKKYTGGK